MNWKLIEQKEEMLKTASSSGFEGSSPKVSAENRRTQHFYCTKCGKKGTVFYVDGAGIYEVIDAIRDEHINISPDCKSGIQFIRVNA